MTTKNAYTTLDTKHTAPRVEIESTGNLRLNEIKRGLNDTSPVIVTEALRALGSDKSRQDYDDSAKFNQSSLTGIPAPYSRRERIADKLLGKFAGNLFFWQHEERRTEEKEANAKRYVDPRDVVYSQAAKQERLELEEQERQKTAASGVIKIGSEGSKIEARIVDTTVKNEGGTLRQNPERTRLASERTGGNTQSFSGFGNGSEFMSALGFLAGAGLGLGSFVAETANAAKEGLSRIASSVKTLVSNTKEFLNNSETVQSVRSTVNDFLSSASERAETSLSAASETLKSAGSSIKNAFNSATNTTDFAIKSISSSIAEKVKSGMSTVFAFKTAATNEKPQEQAYSSKADHGFSDPKSDPSADTDEPQSTI